MKTEVTPEQVAEYQERGFVAIHDFLDAEELEQWRALPFFRARSSIATFLLAQPAGLPLIVPAAPSPRSIAELADPPLLIVPPQAWRSMRPWRIAAASGPAA